VPFSETGSAYRNWQQALLIPLREAIGNKRELRLHILSVVLGFDIDSTNDLCPAEAGALTSMFELEDRWPVILGSIGAAVNVWKERLATIPVSKRPKVKLEAAPPPEEDVYEPAPAEFLWHEVEDPEPIPM
jgi:hypothetical protein